MKLIYNEQLGVVAGYTDYPDEFIGCAPFVVLDMPAGWDDQFRDSVKLVNGMIEIDHPVFLQSIKSEKLSELAAYRYAIETGGITVNGQVINTDRDSQGMLHRAYSTAMAFPDDLVDFSGISGWVLMESAVVIHIAQTVGRYVRRCFSHQRIHAEAIAALETAEEVAAYDFTTGWPA